VPLLLYKLAAFVFSFHTSPYYEKVATETQRKEKDERGMMNDE
jgi:hypothetical protein